MGAPDWLIEILSPGNTTRDTRIKFDLYEENGLLKYWIAYPGVKTVTALTLAHGQYQLTAEYTEPGPILVATLPGLMVEWGDIFSE